jgi:2-methylcitrate dehydratase PrpD
MLVPENSATRELADFAVGLSYDDLPEAVVARLKNSILDALGCCLFGATLPWTRMLIDPGR